MKYILTVLLFCLIIPNIAFGATSFLYGGVEVMHISGCTKTDYPALSDTNEARGTALLSAVANAINGDVLYLSVGDFDIGATNRIDLSINKTGSASLHGSGKNLTIIESQLDVYGAGGKIISFGLDNSQVTDLTIDANGIDIWQFPIGDPGANFQNAWLKNISIIGSSDGIYINAGTSNSLNVINTTIYTNYDCIAIFKGTSLNVYDSELIADGQGWGDALRGVVTDNSDANVNLWNTNITTKNGVDGGILMAGVHNNYGTINIYGGTIIVDNSNMITNKSIKNDNGVLSVSPTVVYDGTKTSGVITNISEVAEVVPILPAETCLYLPLSTDATLNGLSISSGILSPTFSLDTTSYTVSVDGNVRSMTIIPTVSQGNATITVNGTPVISGLASAPINLELGSNTITTVVTAEDGITTKAYTIIVTRASAGIGAGRYYNISDFNINVQFGAGGFIIPLSTAPLIYGGSQTFTITPNEGYKIADVLVDGISEGATTNYTFSNVTRNHTISASFSLIPVVTTLPVITNNTDVINAIKQQLIILITQLLQLLQTQLSAIIAIGQ